MSDLMVGTEPTSDNEALVDTIKPDTQSTKPLARASKSVTKAPKLTATLIKDRYEKGVKAMRAEIRNYWLNYSFLEGEQWVYWNRELNRLDQYPRDEDRVQLPVNRRWPASRRIIAK